MNDLEILAVSCYESAKCRLSQSAQFASQKGHGFDGCKVLYIMSNSFGSITYGYYLHIGLMSVHTAPAFDAHLISPNVPTTPPQRLSSLSSRRMHNLVVHGLSPNNPSHAVPWLTFTSIPSLFTLGAFKPLTRFLTVYAFFNRRPTFIFTAACGPKK